jgi:hypothetical protein
VRFGDSHGNMEKDTKYIYYLERGRWVAGQLAAEELPKNCRSLAAFELHFTALCKLLGSNNQDTHHRAYARPSQETGEEKKEDLCVVHLQILKRVWGIIGMLITIIISYNIKTLSSFRKSFLAISETVKVVVLIIRLWNIHWP